MAKPQKELKEEKKIKNSMPWEDEIYQKHIKVLKDNCKNLIIHRDLPVSCPKSFQNVDYMFMVSIPTLVEVPRVTGVIKPTIFPRLLIASLICPPKYEQFESYSNKTEIEFLQFWKGQVVAERDDYYKLKNYAEQYNIMTYETLYMSDILEKIQDLYDFKER